MANSSTPRTIEAGLRLVRAPNPSPMTFLGTNTWIVGTGEVAVIDPGPAEPAHLTAILDALDPDERITAILVTHAHRDHAPLARPLAERTGARIFAAGNLVGRRHASMARLADIAAIGGGEGIDRAFRPDVMLEDGMIILGETWNLGVLATPGHTADHLSFTWCDAVFTGDHVMGWASSLVSPPDGDLTSFLASCRRLQERTARVFYPGHGDPVADPAHRIAWLISHREARTAQILAALQDGPATPAALARALYTDVDPALLSAAERNVLAHLIALIESDKVHVQAPLSAEALFALS